MTRTLIAAALALALAPAARAATVTVPGEVLMVPLDVATVTTAGVPVNALIAGHRTAGGWIVNPATATAPLCINEYGPASATAADGASTCILPGNRFPLSPSPRPLSVVSSDAAHPFTGAGYTE